MSYIVEHKAWELLQEKGLNFPEHRYVTNKSEIGKAAEEIGYPLAMKIVSESIIHKSDIGGVVLNIANKAEAEDAFAKIMAKARVHVPDEKNIGVILAKMIKGGVEVIVSFGIDKEFGKYVMFGLGGVYVDLFKEVAFDLIPATEIEIKGMINRIRSSKILYGYRGSQPVNVDSLIELILKCSEYFKANNELQEIELNPVVIREEGCYILDAMIMSN